MIRRYAKYAYVSKVLRKNYEYSDLPELLDYEIDNFLKDLERQCERLSSPKVDIQCYKIQETAFFDTINYFYQIDINLDYLDTTYSIYLLRQDYNNEFYIDYEMDDRNYHKSPIIAKIVKILDRTLEKHFIKTFLITTNLDHRKWLGII